MRISGGRLKGSKIRVGSVIPLRPTTEKIREWIFQIIDPYLPGGACLDLFAGTGIMGIEALSRGSRFALFVDHATTKIIRSNVSGLVDKSQWRILNQEALQFLNSPIRQRYCFRVIHADPPYNYDYYLQLIKNVATTRMLELNGLFILESSKHSDFARDHKSLSIVKDKLFGETRITIYKKEDL